MLHCRNIRKLERKLYAGHKPEHGVVEMEDIILVDVLHIWFFMPFSNLKTFFLDFTAGAILVFLLASFGLHRLALAYKMKPENAARPEEIETKGLTKP